MTAVSRKAGWDIAVFPVSERGERIARAISGRFCRTAVLSPAQLKDGGLKREARRAFSRHNALVFISSAGIAVRTIAPLLKDKTRDPAVVVIDEKGAFVISLVSGHLGGANGLSREIASLLKATPVITTATDIRGLPCIEDLAMAFSFAIEEREKIKTVNSAILKGQKVLVVDRDRERLRKMKGAFGQSGVFVFSDRFSPGRGMETAALITGTVPAGVPGRFRSRTMVLRPRILVIGIGCRKGTAPSEIEKAVRGALTKAGLSFLSIRNLATIDIKQKERGLLGFASKIGVPVDFYTGGELDTVTPPSGPSAAALKGVGARAVAEPAAMLSSGARGLCVKKTKKGKVTVAVALAPSLS